MLLLIVLMIAIVTTIVLTLSFRSQTDTQLTESKVQSAQMKEAAEAGIEIGFTLKQANISQTFAQAGFNAVELPGVNLDKSTLYISDGSSATEFVTPLLTKDSMHTFYLGVLTSVQPLTFDPINNYSSVLNVYYGSEISNNADCDDIILEFTLISDTDIVERYIADTGYVLISNYGMYNKGSKISPSTRGGSTFRCLATLTGPWANTRYMFTRLISADQANPNISTRLAYTSTGNLPVQGRKIRSEVWSTAGTLTIVEATQSYPQLPASFFVTSF